jgi:trans-aconitate methyltransferase
VLDLPCGTGRHSLEFSRGYDVTGVDRTAAFIEKAQSAARRAPGAQFEVGDMREHSRRIALTSC